MAAAASPPRRPLALRYSLRMLLLALTAFAIGFPIWYRWYRLPYEEEVSKAARRKGAPVFKQTVTWQRQWGGGRLKHGPESHYMDGELLERTMYRDGQPHGLRNNTIRPARAKFVRLSTANGTACGNGSTRMARRLKRRLGKTACGMESIAAWVTTANGGNWTSFEADCALAANQYATP